MDKKALIKIWNLTQIHPGTSGARVACGVLLGLYNGTRFPLDLTELRLLDSGYLSAAINLIYSDATRCEKEVHEWLNEITSRVDFAERFELLAWRFTIFKRGRCKKNELIDVFPHMLVIKDEE